MNREIKEEISKSAKHILDNYDTIVRPHIPDMAKDVRELVDMCKSGKYSREELLKIAEEKANKLSKKERISIKDEKI